jgi:acyl-coenzyme A synthetase/AMP-(fatty) acid ligase
VPARIEVVDALPRNEIGKVITAPLVAGVRR